MGSTSVVCLVIGYIFKLNQPVTHLFKTLTYPIHLPMILVYIHLGEKLNGVPLTPFSIAEMLSQFKDSPAQFARDFGMAALYGVEAWAISAIFLIPLLRFASLPVLRKLVQYEGGRPMNGTHALLIAGGGNLLVFALAWAWCVRSEKLFTCRCLLGGLHRPDIAVLPPRPVPGSEADHRRRPDRRLEFPPLPTPFETHRETSPEGGLPLREPPRYLAGKSDLHVLPTLPRERHPRPPPRIPLPPHRCRSRPDMVAPPRHRGSRRPHRTHRGNRRGRSDVRLQG